MKKAAKQPAQLAPAATEPERIEWVDDRELARRTPISRAGWATWRARRKGPPYHKVGKRCLYKWHEVLEWFESNRVEAKAS